jgi:hypothetical protein
MNDIIRGVFSSGHIPDGYVLQYQYSHQYHIPRLHPSTTAASLLLLAKFHQKENSIKKKKIQKIEVILEGFNHTQSEKTKKKSKKSPDFLYLVFINIEA